MCNVTSIETVEKIGQEIRDEEEKGIGAMELCKGGCDSLVYRRFGAITPKGFYCNDCLPTTVEGLMELYNVK